MQRHWLRWVQMALIACMLLLNTCASGWAQSNATAPVASVPQDASKGQASAVDSNSADAFDVVSIRANKSGDGGMRWGGAPDGFKGENLNLLNLILNAYQTRPDKLIGLPHWAESDRYDVQAKVLPQGSDFKKLESNQLKKMEQQMLADRFKLKAHYEERDGNVFNLVQAKGGLKLKPVTTLSGGSSESVSLHGIKLHMEAGSMGALSDMLAGALNKDVLDETHATEKYTIDLSWSTEDDTSADASSQSETLPTIYKALEEELGLKLVPAKGKVKYLVIDHVEKPELD